MENKSVSRISSDLLQLLTGSKLVLSVSTEDLINVGDEEKRFHRIYYRATTSDGHYSYFRTTNEPEWTNDGYGKAAILGESFIALDSFNDVVEDLSNNGFISARFFDSIGQPLYVYYDIEFMDEDLKSSFRNHLAGELWKSPDEYLLKELHGSDLRQIEQWKRWLLPPDSEHIDNRQPVIDKYTMKALANSTLVLSLQKANNLHSEVDGQLTRTYFKSQLKSGTEIFFLNTNEPVHQSGYLTNCKKLGSGFTAFYSVDDIIYDINHFSDAADEKAEIHGPPKYVYYDILYVSDDLRQVLTDHLKNEVSEYAVDYFKKHFTKDDQNRITYWKNTLGSISNI